jgi:hypothetical protein
MPRLEPVTIAVRFDMLSLLYLVSLVQAWTQSHSLVAYQEVRLPLLGYTEGHREQETSHTSRNSLQTVVGVNHNPSCLPLRG